MPKPKPKRKTTPKAKPKPRPTSRLKSRPKPDAAPPPVRPAPAPARPNFPKARFWGGLAVFAALSLLFQFVDWDQAVAGLFATQTPPWPGDRWTWAWILYRFGEPPAVATGLLGGLAFGLSFRNPRYRSWRGPGLYLLILLLLGPGLIVNGLAKALAGRPRPFETLGFGGLWEFARPFHFGTPGRGLSFLSGHCASAWYFFGLAWVLPEKWKKAAFGGTLALGAAMSLARVSQGAHWLSDTLLCGALLFSLAAGLSPLVHWQPGAGFWRRPGLGLALGLGALAWLSLSHVRHQDRRFNALWLSATVPAPVLAPQQRLLPWAEADEPDDVVLDLRLRTGTVRVRFDQVPDGQALPVALEARFQGQGLPGSREELDAVKLEPGDPVMPAGPRSLGYRLEQRLSGWWFLKQGHCDLALPRDWGVDLRLHAPHSAVTIAPLPPGRRVLLSRLPPDTAAPPGFHPYGSVSWLREGADPLVALDIQADRAVFEEEPLLPRIPNAEIP